MPELPCELRYRLSDIAYQVFMVYFASLAIAIVVVCLLRPPDTAAQRVSGGVFAVLLVFPAVSCRHLGVHAGGRGRDVGRVRVF